MVETPRLRGEAKFVDVPGGDETPRLLTLRSLLLPRRRVDLQFSLQGFPELGQVTVAHDLPQTWFYIEERGGEPPVSLTRLLPVVDFGAAFLDERIDGLETVRRLQRPAQHAI